MNLRRRNRYLVDLVSEATGGDSYCIEKIGYMLADKESIERVDVWHILDDYRVPHAAIIEEDFRRIYSGFKPRYFVSHMEIARRYQKRHGIFSIVQQGDIDQSPDEMLNSMIERNKSDVARFGVSLEGYREGMACYEEQKHFYDTPEWKDRAKVVRLLDRYKCRMCGKKNRTLHVHHDEPIQSMFSPIFNHNFDSGRLRTFCASCHEKWHSDKVREFYAFEFADPDKRKDHMEYLKRLAKAHDMAKECRFCFGTSS